MKEMFPTSKYLTRMKVISSQTLFLVLAYLTCCIWAWPAASPSVYRRNSNANLNLMPFSANVPTYEGDYPQLPLSDGFNNYNSQWDRAKEPLNYYDLLDDYLMNQPSSGADAETYPNVADLYEPPVWGKIVKEKPESELEELKAEEREREAEDRQRAEDAAQYQYYAYDYAGHPQKRGQTATAPPQPHPAAAAAADSMASSSLTTTEKSIDTSAPTSNQRPGTSTLTPKKVAKLLHPQPGMKEFPMLRPPNKVKQALEQQHHTEEENQNLDDQEPVIAVAQRSVVEKPSAYDKLRKYLSLEDALKKEAEKRRSTSSRVQKRAPAGNKHIVTDVDTLSGQLNNLKKSII